jgi:segregation and condensation protein A
VTEPRDESLHEPEEAAWEEEPVWSPPAPEEIAGEEPAAPPREESRGGYRVRLPVFEGPLDLLLHLIRVNEINIYDIPIAEVTRQYLAYLDLMRDLHLEVAAEYLVMAATLAFVKSKTMLPAPPRAEEAQEDPRAELRDLLLEYQRVKSAAAALRSRDEEAVRTWGVGAAPPESRQGEPAVEVSLFDLLAAFQRVLASIGEEARLEFRRDTLRVADAMRRILDLLELAPALLFEELIVAQPGRASRIVVFLALLELVRLQMVRATQARLAGHILLWRRLPRLLPSAPPPSPKEPNP